MRHAPLNPPQPSQLHIQTSKLNKQTKKELKKPKPPQTLQENELLLPLSPGCRLLTTSHPELRHHGAGVAAMLGFGAPHRPRGGKTGGGCVLRKKMLGCGFRREVEMYRWSGITQLLLMNPLPRGILSQDMHGGGHGPSRFSIHFLYIFHILL